MSDAEIKTPSKARAGFFTFFGLATIAALVAMPLVAGEPAEGMVNQWGKFLGRLHPLILHLPIGMLTLVILLELGKLFKRDKGSSTIVPMFFTSASAVVAVVFGFLLYHSNVGEYNQELVESHLWWGIGFAGATVAAFVLKAWVDVSGGSGNFVYLLTLLATGGVMAVASHDGGSLTHGQTYLTDEAPNEVRELYNMIPNVEPLPLLDQPGNGEGGDGVESVPTIPKEEQIIFTHLVQPILDQKCVSCHGEDRQRGRLRMDSYEALLAGGKEGSGLEPGNALDSNIIFRIHLPLDDDEHMPPADKKQIEEHELVILEWWIDSGASPDAKVIDVEAPEPVKLAMSKLVPPEVLAAEKAAAEAAVTREADARAALTETVNRLREVFPAALNFESQSSSGLTFTAVSMRKDFGDEELRQLEPVIPALVSLDLSATNVTDDGVALLSKAENLKVLRLPETAVTDGSIEVFAGLPNLESLNLYSTAVTNEGVMKLADLPNLQRLYLWQTQVDDAGVTALREKMPQTEVVLGL